MVLLRDNGQFSLECQPRARDCLRDIVSPLGIYINLHIKGLLLSDLSAGQPLAACSATAPAVTQVRVSTAV